MNTVNLGATSKTGGIAGEVSNAYIVDTSVSATGNNILGRYYVGGIVGAMSSGTSIYNVSVDGTIGGNGAYTVGGITGYYEGGEIVVAACLEKSERQMQGQQEKASLLVPAKIPLI